LRLDLFWRGAADDADTVVRIALENGEPALLWQDALAPDANWRDGETICRRLRLRVPTGVEAGAYQLTVSVSGETVDLGPVDVVESTRNYALPPVAQTLGATFGNDILLHGYEVESETDGSELAVTLVWQALETPSNNYKVFVHLVNEDGEIVAQSDAEPAGGYATVGWLSGEVVIDTHSLNVPEGSDADEYRLRVGLYEPVSGERLPAVDVDGRSLLDGAALLEP
jgi:hypothetical protein